MTSTHFRLFTDSGISTMILTDLLQIACSFDYLQISIADRFSLFAPGSDTAFEIRGRFTMFLVECPYFIHQFFTRPRGDALHPVQLFSDFIKAAPEALYFGRAYSIYKTIPRAPFPYPCDFQNISSNPNSANFHLASLQISPGIVAIPYQI